MKHKNRNIHKTKQNLLKHGSTETNISVQHTADSYVLLDYTMLFMHKEVIRVRLFYHVSCALIWVPLQENNIWTESDE